MVTLYHVGRRCEVKTGPEECSLGFEEDKTVRKGGVWRQTGQNDSAVPSIALGGESRGPSIVCAARLRHC